jgi:hypothetical protein
MDARFLSFGQLVVCRLIAEGTGALGVRLSAALMASF